MELRIKEIMNCLEQHAPALYQESYDNSGLLVGNETSSVKKVLLTLDCTESIVDEAISNQCGLIIAHHPILFSGIKRLNGKNYIERTILKAIQNNIAIYAMHTNLDNMYQGVNLKMAEKLGLIDTKVLQANHNILRKLVTFVPSSHAEAVREAMFEAGAGQIGHYSHCSFNTQGTGTFKGNESAKPFVGEINELHKEEEVKIEVIFPIHLERNLLQAIKNAHPYEEVAYDILLLGNSHPSIGAGLIGHLKEDLSEMEALKMIKAAFGCKTVRHTSLCNKMVKKIALCGGSGSFLLNQAIAQQADLFISADFKYHQFFDADGRILIADIGHYESEQFTPEIFSEILSEKFPNFAIRLSEINTNPINYL